MNQEVHVGGEEGKKKYSTSGYQWNKEQMTDEVYLDLEKSWMS